MSIVMKLNYPLSGKIVLRDNDRMWVVAPGELGLTIDPEASAEAAFRVGRSGFITNRIREQIDAAYAGSDVSPVMVYDQRAAFRYLATWPAKSTPLRRRQLAPQRNRGDRDPGQFGRALDVQSLLSLVPSSSVAARRRIRPVYSREHALVILDASAEAELARTLSAPLDIDLPGDRPAGPAPGRSNPTSWPRRS